MARTVLAILGCAAVGLVVAIGLGVVLVAVGVRDARRSGSVDPSEKAVVLGRSIAEAMNWSAAAGIVLVPVGAVVGWRRGRRRRDWRER